MIMERGGMSGFTVDEVDVAVQSLLRCGVSAADVVGGALKAALQLAQAGGLSAEDAGAVAAKAIDTMHLGALAVLTADLPAPPVAGQKTAAQLLRERREAGITAADIPKSYSTGAGEPEREALRGAVGGVLCNAKNFPEKAAVRILGQDMGPLIDRTADAILAAGYRRKPEPRVVTTVEELDALPLGTLIEQRDGFRSLKKSTVRWHLCVDSAGSSGPEEIELPAVVLFVPVVKA